MFTDRVALSFTLFALSGLASAEIPSVLKHVPDDAAMVLVTSNLRGLLTDVTAFIGKYGENLPDELRQGLAASALFGLMLNQPGVDATGAAAIVLEPGEAVEGADPLGGAGLMPAGGVAFLPIGDFDAFTGSPFIQAQGARVEHGVLPLEFGGMTAYLTDVGDYAMVALDRETLDEYTVGREITGAQMKRLGSVGERLIEDNDVALLANVPVLGERIGAGVAAVEQQANFLAIIGGGEQIKTIFSVIRTAADGFVTDGEFGLLGLSYDESGVTLDLGANFREGSPIAGLMTGGADASELLGRVPEMPFLLAYAADLSSPGVRTMIDGTKAIMAQAGDGEPGADLGLAKLLVGSGGFSGAIGASPAVGGAGLLANQIAFTASDEPKSLLTDLRDTLRKADGVTAGGMKYTTTYEEQGAEVAGRKVDVYTVGSEIDPASPPVGLGMMADPAMIQQILYGFSGGPNGYIVASEGGVYATAARNSQLLTNALTTLDGGASLTSAEAVKGVAAKLPGKSTAMAFISADQLANSIGPFAVMVGALNEFEQAPPMPPIGLAASIDDGGLLIRAHAPAEVLDFVTELQNGGGGSELQRDDSPDAGSPRPRF